METPTPLLTMKRTLLCFVVSFSFLANSLQCTAQSSTFTLKKNDKKLMAEYSHNALRITHDSVLINPHYFDKGRKNPAADWRVIAPDSDSQYLYSIPEEKWATWQRKLDSLVKTANNDYAGIRITIFGDVPKTYILADFYEQNYYLGNYTDPDIVEARKMFQALVRLSKK